MGQHACGRLRQVPWVHDRPRQRQQVMGRTHQQIPPKMQKLGRSRCRYALPHSGLQHFCSFHSQLRWPAGASPPRNPNTGNQRAETNTQRPKRLDQQRRPLETQGALRTVCLLQKRSPHHNGSTTPGSHLGPCLQYGSLPSRCQRLKVRSFFSTAAIQQISVERLVRQILRSHTRKQPPTLQ